MEEEINRLLKASRNKENLACFKGKTRLPLKIRIKVNIFSNSQNQSFINYI